MLNEHHLRQVLTGLRSRSAMSCWTSVDGPRPSRAVHSVIRHGPGRRRHRGREDSAPKPQGERLRGKVRAHRPHRGHRPDADLRKTTPADSPGRVPGPLQRTTPPSQPPAAPAPPRPPRRRPLPGADQTPARPRRSLHEYERAA
jgi:hypothetical protein